MKTSLAAGERAVSIVLALLGAFALWQSFPMPAGQGGVPGPGFFPQALSLLLLAAGICLALRLSLGAPDSAEVALGHRNLWLAFVALIGMALLLERLGFFLATALFLVVLLRSYSSLGWLKSVIAAAGAAALAYYLFNRALGVPLPMGTLLNLPFAGG